MKRKNFFRVKPILVGEFGPVREDIKFRGGDPFKAETVPSYLFYLESGEKHIVVDTGLNPSQETAQLVGLECKGEDLADLLQQESIDPEKVDLVICTHLHWDHVGNLELFRKARIVCQRSEIGWAFSPPHWEMGYLRVFLEPLWEASERILAVDGNMKLFEGINLIKVGGHTPGSQVVEVDTAEGKVVIAGDLIMSFENLQREWPIGLFWSLEECMRGIRYLREQDVLVLPGHDWKVGDIDSIG